MARRVSTYLSLCLVLALSVVGAALPTAASAKQEPGSAAAKDPRSGAALNREAAKKPGPLFGPIFPDPDPRQRIHPLTLNNAGADATAQDTQSETSVAVVGASGVTTAWNDSGSFLGGANHFTGYGYSTNNGLSFTDPGTLPASAEGDAGDPVLAANTTSGNVFQATLGFTTGENIQVFKSTDGGQTYGAPVNGTPGYAGTGDFQDKEWMALDNFAGTGQNNIYLCWTRFPASPGAEIRLTRSTDNGATFGPSGGTLLSAGGQGCYVVVGPDHSVYVFYYRGTDAPYGNGGDNKLFVRKSTDRGVTFAPEVQVADLATTTINGGLQLNGGVRSNSFPHAAVNPVSGHIVVVYNDDPNLASSADNGNVRYTRSVNGGATWAAPVTVNSETRDQFFPTASITPNGQRIMFGYYSRNHDPQNLMFHRRGRLGTMNTATGAISLNRSFQLSPNTPLAVGQDPVINPTYMGDYDQIAASSASFYSTWSDNRAGNTFHRNQPDVRFARIAAVPTTSDVGVSVSASPTSIELGKNTTITVNVTASGNSASDVFVNIPAITGLSVKSVNVASGQCDTVNQFVGCSLGTIPSGATKSIQIVATGSGAAATRTVSATATTTSNDTNAANDTASTSIPVSTGSAVTQTFSTGNITVPIPDVATIDVPVTIPTEGTAVRVYPRVRLNHTWDADLDLFLVAPSGKTVELSRHNGGSGDNYGSGTNDCAGTKTLFDDFQATPISAGTAPFAGNFKPEQPLADLVGEPNDGVWRLRIRDDAPADVGTVGCFQLSITKVP